MRHNAMLGMLLAAAAAVGGPQALPNDQQMQLTNLVNGLPTGTGKTHRSKVKPDRGNRRRNMNHVGRRVRRKHRRAA